VQFAAQKTDFEFVKSRLKKGEPEIPYTEAESTGIPE